VISRPNPFDFSLKDKIMIDTSKINPSESMLFAIRFGDNLLVKTIQIRGDGCIALVSRKKITKR
jgi:hypothetical protein